MEAICNPKEISSVQLNQWLLTKLEKNDCKNELMRKYAVFLSVGEQSGHMGMRLFIQGNPTDVSNLTEFIKTMNPDASTSKNNSSKENEDEIIWIDDPYEVFDQTSSTTTNKNDTDSDKKEIENQMNQLKFNATKNMISPSIQNNGPLSKKPNTQKNNFVSDCEIIDITESKEQI